MKLEAAAGGCGCRHIVLGAAAAFLSGCSAPSEKMLPVAGNVTINNKPVTVGAVSFRPDAAKGNKSLHHPTGDIDSSGRFELFTVGKKGAPAGWYKVLVFADANALSPQGGSSPLPPKWLADVKYTSADTTDLTIEVAESTALGAYDLKLSK